MRITGIDRAVRREGHPGRNCKPRLQTKHLIGSFYRISGMQ